jgi:DNA mismatch endonuclease, patch repair protein
MADVFTTALRSRVMSKIRSRGNQSTELRLIRLFRDQHITGWRRGVRLFGNPDFVFYKQRVAIFVDGCFWHGCPRCRNTPSANASYWLAKNQRNRKRDRLVTRTLSRRGWHVIRIWEHRLRKGSALITSLSKILSERAKPKTRSAVPVSFAIYKSSAQAGMMSRQARRSRYT